MAVSKKPLRKKTETQDDPFASGPSFPDIRDGYDERAEEETAAKGPTMEDLIAKIGELQSQVEQSQKERMALFTAAPVKTDTAPQAVELKLDDLPDPTLSPEAYSKALSERVAGYVKSTTAAEQARLNAERQGNNRVEQLWSEFSTKHAEYAENQELAEFAALQVARELQGKGIDLERYMFQNRDAYFKDVVTKMDKLVPKAEPEAEAEPERTAGIFGGLESGGAPARGRQPQRMPDMVQDLQESQRKSGFF
jgi:hypothetical protein